MRWPSGECVNHKLTRALGASLVLLGALAWTAAAPPAANALTNCTVDDLTVDGEEQAFLRLINDYRAKNGITALSLDPAEGRLRLQPVACTHAGLRRHGARR